jgi:hypothetical protein
MRPHYRIVIAEDAAILRPAPPPSCSLGHPEASDTC